MAKKNFTTEDARKQLILRSYALNIEKKCSELQATDNSNGTIFTQVELVLRNALSQLDALTLEARGTDCWDGYEDCNGICRVWCSE